MTVERLIETRDLKSTKLHNLMRRPPELVDYDPESDTLFISYVSPTTETVIHYIDDHIALVYEADTLEVVGFQVEAFEYSFMVTHNSVQNAWRLSETGAELEDTGDLLIMAARKKHDIAREVTSIAEQLLEEKGMGRLVPA